MKGKNTSPRFCWMQAKGGTWRKVNIEKKKSVAPKVAEPVKKKRKKNRAARKNRYYKYLQSPQWRIFRAEIIKERGAKCEKCQKETKQIQAHHKTYARIYKERKEDILLVCRECHEAIHHIKP